MVTTRKRKMNIIIGVIVVILIVVLAIYLFLYFTTDMFKSSKVLFGKYLGISAKNAETLLEDSVGQEYNNKLQNNKYVSNTEIKAEYTTGVGTTGENTNNPINNLQLTINGKTDKLSGVDYKNFLVRKDEENVAELEYLKSNDKYGIRLKDLFGKYIAIENKDLKSIAANLDLDWDVPNKIENFDFANEFRFTGEELNTINETYGNIIEDGFEKAKFSKSLNENIEVRDQVIEANAYKLNLTKEELNNIYISILEQMKKDEVLLTKVDLLDQMLNPGELAEENSDQVPEEGEQQNEEVQNEENQQEQPATEQENSNVESTDESPTVYEEYITRIDKEITDIKNKNIGKDESNITVYENDGNAVRTKIETSEYVVTIDTIFDANGDLYFDFYKEINGMELNTDEILIERRNEAIYFNRVKNANGQTQKTHFSQERKIVNGTKETATNIGYDIGKNKISIDIMDKKEILNGFDEVQEYTNNNYVVLNQFSEDDYAELKEILNDKGIEKLKAISEEINIDELINIPYQLELLPEQISISNVVTLTMSEVSKFNAEFEVYKGESIDAKTVESFMGLVRENLESVEILSNNNNAIKLNIVKGNKNEQLAQKVLEIVNRSENKDKKYSISYEYDEETQMIKAIILEMIQR